MEDRKAMKQPDLERFRRVFVACESKRVLNARKKKSLASPKISGWDAVKRKFGT